jgi:archaellum component FlaC
MADVTLEDLQKVNTRLSALEAAVKEANRLLKIQDDFGSDGFKRMSDDTIAIKNSVKALEKRLGDLEKKVKK